jgi:hypothetical protein
MKIASSVVILLAMTTSALAQPGATPPTEGPPPPPDGAGAPMEPPQDRGRGIDIDELIARAEAASPTLEAIARGTFQRARRSIALGPTVGFWAGGVLAQDEGIAAITFGLGLEKFKIPVLPSMQTLKQLVMERAKAKLREQLIARFVGQTADPISAEQFAREVWEEAIMEILGLENTRARTMERPSFSVALEVNRTFNLEAWTPRVRIGFGVSRVTLGASFGVGLGTEQTYYPNTPAYVGFEVVTHFLTSKNPRSSVVDAFLRVDLEMRNRDTNTDQLVIGLRYLLDII